MANCLSRCFHDIGCLEPFWALDDFKLDGIALGQRLEAFALDCGEMDKHIFCAFLLDKAEALGVVEPLYCACCQLNSPPFCAEFTSAPTKKGKNRKFWSLPYRFRVRLHRRQKLHAAIRGLKYLIFYRMSSCVRVVGRIGRKL